MKFTIQPLTAEQAHAMIGWRYEPPYDNYNIVAADPQEEVAYLSNPENHYYGIVDAQKDLVGHCVFHEEGRVPGGDYTLDALDIGIGMRPDWTGHGSGTELARAVFEFGITRYQAQRLRATVAAWNDRAQKVCTNNGFREVSRFVKSGTDREFVILLKDVVLDLPHSSSSSRMD